MKISLTVAEAFDALAKHGEVEEGAPPNTYPLYVIKQALCIGNASVSKVVGEWIKEGSVQVVSYRKRALDGRLMTLKGFQFIAPPKRRKRAA